MTSLPCTCIFEHIKLLASSSVWLSAGCSQHQEVSVVKRNKDFKSGDFIVFVPSQRKLENVDVDSSVKPEIVSGESTNEDSVHDSGLRLFSVETASQVEKGKFLVKLERPSVYREVLRQTLFDSRRFCVHCMHLRDGTAMVNCSMLNDFLKEEETADDCRQLNLDQLRQFLVTEHVARLLRGNGICVSVIAYPKSEIVSRFFDGLFGTDVNFTVPTSSETDHKPTSQNAVSRFDCSGILDKYRHSSYAVETDDKREVELESSKTEDSRKLDEVVLDLKKFVADNLSRLPVQQNSLRKNLDKVYLNRNSSIVSQISHLENHRFRQELETEVKQNTFCVHVTSYEREFNQHLVTTAWQLLEPKVSAIKQVHVICGPTSGRRGAKPQISAQGLFELRYKQMKDAFTIKYGTDIPEDHWKDKVLSLTKAAIKFEMLSTFCRQEVKLSLATDISSDGLIDNKGGVFVMYNFARLSTLFLHFEAAVERGTYPALTDFDSIDFSLLKQEEEWGLLFNYILSYPSVLKETVAGLDQSSFQSIHTHKICQFLLSLSSSLSIYYSKTHILCESRPHLMPLMFARLYLMKGIQKLMKDCFSLLGIEPCSQL